MSAVHVVSKPAKRGRPSLGAAALSEILPVRFAASELAAIRSIAAGEGISAGAWIRARVIEGMGLPLLDAAQPITDLKLARSADLARPTPG